MDRLRRTTQHVAPRGLVAELTQLAQLRTDGLLTDGEFAAAKQQLLPSTLARSAEASSATSQQSRVIATGGSPFYSGAHVHQGIVYCAGAIGRRKGEVALVAPDVTAQTIQTLDNLAATLADAGSDLSRVLRTTCYLADIADYQLFNDAYLQRFSDESRRPARVCFAVGALPFDAKVEIEALAYV